MASPAHVHGGALCRISEAGKQNQWEAKARGHFSLVLSFGSKRKNSHYAILSRHPKKIRQNDALAQVFCLTAETPSVICPLVTNFVCKNKKQKGEEL
ncbi:hypothetical protein [Chrysiogenes arsenatis]|uniref:hypothetical protein n=1 Tax=Chrysiogenes arsenatis TaxID=309797 RepID=UPI0012687156|nr:hypothetical protein [Chrysiogenes arsenatis]